MRRPGVEECQATTTNGILYSPPTGLSVKAELHPESKHFYIQGTALPSQKLSSFFLSPNISLHVTEGHYRVQ